MALRKETVGVTHGTMAERRLDASNPQRCAPLAEGGTEAGAGAAPGQS